MQTNFINDSSINKNNDATIIHIHGIERYNRLGMCIGILSLISMTPIDNQLIRKGLFQLYILSVSKVYCTGTVVVPLTVISSARSLAVLTISILIKSVAPELPSPS